MVVVKSVTFAQKIMLAFNKLELRGTITIISCDDYLQKAVPTPKSGTPLTEVIVDGACHPLRNLFSTIIYDEETDLLSTDYSCIQEESGVLTMLKNDLQLPNVQIEYLLQTFYETQIDLIHLQQEDIDLSPLDLELKQEWENISQRVQNIEIRKRDLANFVTTQQELQTKMIALLHTKEVLLNRTDFQIKITQRLIEMITNGEVNSDKEYYHRKIFAMGSEGTDPGIDLRIKYDPSKVKHLIEELG